jgi:hypothetical protein
MAKLDGREKQILNNMQAAHKIVGSTAQNKDKHLHDK